VLGIVGGLASGKSTVARLLAERGARIVDADTIGHEALKRSAVKDAIRRAFGQTVLDPDGQVNHARLAEEVFGQPTRVAELNSIVHPLILAEIRAQVKRLKEERAVPLVVLDAALLMETGLDRELCQALLFVDTPRAFRRERAADRSLSAEQFDRREQAQLPEEAKRERADFVVQNGGALEDLRQQVDELWPALCEAGKEGPK